MKLKVFLKEVRAVFSLFVNLFPLSSLLTSLLVVMNFIVLTLHSCMINFSRRIPR